MHSTTRSSRSRSAASRAANAPSDCGELVHEHVEDARVPLAERLRRRALDEDDARADPGDLDGQREPGRERATGAPRARRRCTRTLHASPRGARPGVLAVRGERVLLHREQRRLGEPRARADEEVRAPRPGRASSAAATSQGTMRGSRSTTRSRIRAWLSAPPDLARDLGGRLERLEPPLGLGVEPRPLAAQVDLLEGAQHRLA